MNMNFLPKNANTVSTSGRVLTCFPHHESQLSDLLRFEGYDVREVSCENLIAVLDETTDVVMLDTAKMFERELARIYRKIREKSPDVSVLIACDTNANEKFLREMMSLGCSILFRPCQPLVALSVVEQGVRIARGRRDASILKRGFAHATLREEITPISDAGQKLDARITLFTKGSKTLLIEGERGCGKSTVAERLHREGNGNAPFYAILCDTVHQDSLGTELFGNGRPGKLDLISEGTVFFDHVDKLSFRLQERLNDFLRTRKPGFRIIASSKKVPFSAFGRQRLLKNLATMLDGTIVSIPALSERTEDIPAFSRLFLERLARHSGRPVKEISHEAMEKLRVHSWPENLKELESVLHAAAHIAENGAITEKTIFFDSEQNPKPEFLLAGRTLESVDKQLLEETLVVCKGNRVETAKSLGISEKTVYNMIRRYRLDE